MLSTPFRRFTSLLSVPSCATQGSKALFSCSVVQPAPVKFEVSEKNYEILKETLPAVADAGTNFTKYFYNRMFTAVPCLRDVFNNTNQAVGNQPQKLFGAVAEAAVSVVEKRDFDEDMAESIAHKHCGLNVQGPNYDIVGEHLLGTISECLTDDQAVLGAWGELYGQFAQALKDMEEKLYKETDSKEGGWRGLRDFEIFERHRLGDGVARIHFRPVDGGKVCSFESGQFTTVWAKPEGWANRQPRHYTLNVPNMDQPQPHFAITVRKQGQMSDFLHTAEMGTKVQLSAPYGSFRVPNAEDVWLRDSTTPVVFLSAGVGITPTFAMIESIEGQQHGPIVWLHAAENGLRHPYRSRLIQLASTRPWLTRRVWYERPTEEDKFYESVPENLKKFHFEGRMDFKIVEDVCPFQDSRTYYYFCGPPKWMDKVINDLQATYNVPKSQLRYESF